MIDVRGVNDKWLKILLHLQNAVPTVFKITCPDMKTAQKTHHGMRCVILRHPTWFHMVVCQRGCDVYVVKVNDAQKVVIRDEVSEL